MISDDIFRNLDSRFPSATAKFGDFARLYEPVRDEDGAFAEFGVANGGGTRELARLAPERTVYAFDTYEGMPGADYRPGEDYDNPPGKWKPLAGPDELFAGIPNVVPMVGRFAETLPLIPESQRFVLVHIDCDYYESYMQILDFLLERMVPGGAALLDDNRDCRGAGRAVSEWISRHSDRAELIPVSSRYDRIIWRA